MLKTVTKRTGFTVPYNREKIYRAIEGANSDGKQQIIYKHAISTIVPIHPVSLQEEPCLPSDE